MVSQCYTYYIWLIRLTPCRSPWSMATDHLSPSRYVFCCRLHFPAAVYIVPKTCTSGSLFQVFFDRIPGLWPCSFSVVLVGQCCHHFCSTWVHVSSIFFFLAGPAWATAWLVFFLRNSLLLISSGMFAILHIRKCLLIKTCSLFTVEYPWLRCIQIQ